jgi:hypothetical protein
MRERRIKILIVAVPIAITLLVFLGRLIIETEAERYQAELRACFEEDDDSERCRVLRCLAEAGDDQARADCVETRGGAATSTAS